MLGLDTRSLMVMLNMLALLCSGILLMLRSSFPPSIGGLSYWSLGLFGIVLANLVGSLITVFPTFLFVLAVANVLLVAAAMSYYAGFRQFAGSPPTRRPLVIVLLLLFGYVIWFTYIDNNYQARVFIVTAINGVLFLFCAVEVKKSAGDTIARRFTGIVFAILGSVSLVRAFLLLLKLDTPSSFFSASAGQQMYLAMLIFTMLASTFGAMMMANDRLRATLEFIVSHDQLTGAYARMAFVDLLTKELARGKRSKYPTALMMFDLDHFKSINDRFGHGVGDRVLIDFVKRTKKLLRNTDTLGRYGGEEFIALLPQTSLDDAKLVAERVCAGIANANDGLPPYTVSIGIAGDMEGNTPLEILLSNADQALYQAKANGRNRVALADTTSEMAEPAAS